MKKSTRQLSELLQKPREKRRADIASIVIAALFALAGILTAFLVREQYKSEVFLAISSVAFSYLIYEQLQRPRQLANLEIQIELLRIEFDELSSNGRSLGTYATKLEKLSRLDQILHATGLSALNIALANVWFSVSDDNIVVKGRTLATQSYERFWEEVVSQLPLIKPNLSRRLIARITHAGDIGSWYKDQSDRLNVLHSAFSRTGSVFRIFIDTETLERADAVDTAISRRLTEYRHLMEKMRRNGISCIYLNPELTEKNVRLGDTKDFCIISELDYSAEWETVDSGVNKGEVRQFTLTGTAVSYDRNLANWENIVAEIDGYNYDSPSILPADGKFFAQCRDEFRASLNNAVAEVPPSVA